MSANRDIGIGRVTAKSDDDDLTLAERAEVLVAKTEGATFAHAADFVAHEHPDAYERWRRESYQ